MVDEVVAALAPEVGVGEGGLPVPGPAALRPQHLLHEVLQLAFFLQAHELDSNGGAINLLKGLDALGVAPADGGAVAIGAGELDGAEGDGLLPDRLPLGPQMAGMGGR